jgi:hypothetical protein
VVGVRVAAVLVVGDQDVRPELADDPYERFGGDVEGLRGETAVGERGLGVSLGQPGVDEAEPAVLHAEDLGGACHLGAADLRHVLQHFGAVHGGVEDAARLAPGARDDHDLVAFGDVARRGGRSLAGLVVGVRVHRHESQRAGTARVDRGHGTAAFLPARAPGVGRRHG